MAMEIPCVKPTWEDVAKAIERERERVLQEIEGATLAVACEDRITARIHMAGVIARLRAGL